MSKLNERRIVRASFRANEYGSGARKLSGYAATFGTVTRIGGKGQDSFHEVLSRASFTDALKKSDVRALVNHDPNQLLARSTAGTLRLAEDNKGLRFEIDLPNTTLAKDLYELVRTGAMDECSFAFRVAPGGDTFTDYDCMDAACCGMRGSVLRTINKVDELFDVSTVTYPAYSGTSVSGMLVEDLSKSGDDDNDDDAFDPINYLGAVVPAEVRQRVATARRTVDPDAWYAAASQRLDAADDEKRHRRLAAVTQQIRISDAVEELDLRSQAARDIAFAEDVAYTRRAAGWLRHPHTFPGTCEDFLRWLTEFQA